MAAPPPTTLKLSSKEPRTYSDILQAEQLAALPPSEVDAELHLPAAGPGERRPAVVQLHGSFGFLEHHHKHRENLVNAGFAVLQIYSFASRGVTSTAEKQGAVTMATLTYDAYCGLAALRAHPAIDASRIGLGGWSLGGGATVYGALDVVSRAVNPKGLPGFAAHLGVYPGLPFRTAEGHTWTRSPMVLLCGTADDYTPIEHVEVCSARINEQGGKSKVLSYPGGHHSFDNPTFNDGKLLYNPKFEALGPAPGLDMLLDGTLHITGHPEQPVNSAEDYQKFGQKYIKLGAHAGGDAALAPLAFRDVLRFFQDHLGEAARSKF